MRRGSQVVVTLMGLTLAACTGLIGDPGTRSSGNRPDPTKPPPVPVDPTDPNNPNPPGPIEPPPVCTPGELSLGPAPLRRLSHVEYANTVRDLFPGITVPTRELAPDRTVYGFENNADAQASSPVLVEQYHDSASQIAEAVVANMDRFRPCAPPTTSAAMSTCGRTIIESFGRRAFRRPLTTEEVDRFAAFFDTQLTAHNFDVAVHLIVEAILLSPQFLYRIELGLPDSGTELVKLDPYETATRLSYLVWSSAPDEALLTAAAEGRLESGEQRATEVRRMLSDARARESMVNFHRQWLGFGRLDNVNKDPAAHPSFDEDLKSAMRSESSRFVEQTIFDGDGTLRALLTSNRTWVNAPLAEVYGVQAPPPGQWALVELPANERAGILTQATFLASHGHAVHPSPVLRGVYVIDRILCDTIEPPAIAVDTTPPSPEEHEGPTTNRERYAEHVNNAACAGCHDRIDSVGFALENYDSIGRYRTMDGTLPVDAKTTLTGTDVDGALEGGVTLATKLASSKQVQRCVTTEWFRFAFGRGETRDDYCAISGLDETFATANQDIQELLVAIAASDAFVYRPAPVSR
jgi:hypothetical protein